MRFAGLRALQTALFFGILGGLGENRGRRAAVRFVKAVKEEKRL